MAKRSYNRRSDDQIINDLQGRIKQLEERIEARKRTDSPVLKEIPKVKKTLARFAQLCMDNHRGDLSNTILAFLSTLESQARQRPGARSARMAEPHELEL